MVAWAPYARMKFRQVNNWVLLFRRSGKKDSGVDNIVSRYAGRPVTRKDKALTLPNSPLRQAPKKGGGKWSLGRLKSFVNGALR
jgi:hypothetical protein